MEIMEIIKKRRSVRAFKEGEVPEIKLQLMVDAARMAPSGCNIQPIDYVIVRDKAKLQAFAKSQSFIGNAAAVIAVVADPTSTWWAEDASAGIQNMLLVISAMGYGACWVQGAMAPHREEYEKLLKIPATKRLFALVPVGIPAGSPTPPAKRSLQDVLKWETYQ